MRCAEVRDLLQPFLDGELEVERSVVMLKHLELCPPCHERVECERRLHSLVAPACSERLCTDSKAKLLAACYARCAEADGECLDAVAPPRRRRWLAAAALFVGVGGSLLAFLPHARCAFRKCPKTRVMEVAHQQSLLLPPLPIESDALRQCMVAARTEPPAIAALDLKGGTPLLLETGEVPLFRYACKCDGSEVVVFRLPDAHFHSWQRTQQYDGLDYISYTTETGVRILGWNDGEGGLWCMMGRAERVPEERLVAVASPLRRGH